MTLLLLLFVFGSVVAALLPLGVGILSIVLSLGVTAFLARFSSRFSRWYWRMRSRLR